jgi:hypothetical protein
MRHPSRTDRHHAHAVIRGEIPTPHFGVHPWGIECMTAEGIYMRHSRRNGNLRVTFHEAVHEKGRRKGAHHVIFG